MFVKFAFYDLYDDRYKVELVDDDFREKIIYDKFGLEYIETALSGLIDIYEKRNLPVAANLTKAIIWIANEYKTFTIGVIIKHCKNNPKFAKYEKDIEKYLLLL
jgi:hypothetical protein